MQEQERLALVIHYSRSNYGNHLVNYAAKQVLRRCGYEVDLIVFEGGERARMRAAILRLPRKLVRLARDGDLRDRIARRLPGRAADRSAAPAQIHGRNDERIQKFREFSDSYLRPRSCDVNDRRGLVTEYVRFVVGSDQIWNYDYELGPWQFLDFADPDSMLALSPSVGHEAIPAEWTGEYQRWLSRFDEVGVRELGWTASIPVHPAMPSFTRLIDPTLALEVDEWARLKTASSVSGGILLYELGDLDSSERQFVETVTGLHGLPVHHLSDSVQGPLWETNAADFLGLLAESACVVTDSYHGAIFAFLFDRPLVILRRRGFAGAMNSRIETLLETLHLSDRLIDAVDPATVLTHDYSAGRASLTDLRQEFWAYLGRHGLSPADQHIDDAQAER